MNHEGNFHKKLNVFSSFFFFRWHFLIARDTALLKRRNRFPEIFVIRSSIFLARIWRRIPSERGSNSLGSNATPGISAGKRTCQINKVRRVGKLDAPTRYFSTNSNHASSKDSVRFEKKKHNKKSLHERRWSQKPKKCIIYSRYCDADPEVERIATYHLKSI